jgi:hypothetical protein
MLLTVCPRLRHRNRATFTELETVPASAALQAEIADGRGATTRRDRGDPDTATERRAGTLVAH